MRNDERETAAHDQDQRQRRPAVRLVDISLNRGSPRHVKGPGLQLMAAVWVLSNTRSAAIVQANWKAACRQEADERQKNSQTEGIIKRHFWVTARADRAPASLLQAGGATRSGQPRPRPPMELILEIHQENRLTGDGRN